MTDKPFATGGFVPGPGSGAPPIALTGCDFGAVMADLGEVAWLRAADDGTTDGDPHTWAAVAGNCGPVRVVEAADA